jgi:putative endonuclease
VPSEAQGAKEGFPPATLSVRSSYGWQATQIGYSAMTYVYLLRSITNPEQRYVGKTDDLRRRLAEHNSGKSFHTSKHVPWKLVVAMAFADDRKALAFERYLKTGSGHAFAGRHFW